jgi:hypothetical protein
MVESFPRLLDKFQIMTWNGVPGQNPILLETTDVQHSVLAAAVHFALLLLEQKEGHAALKKMGLQIGETLVPKHVTPDWASHPLIRDMELLVTYFLGRLRSGFCNLVITETDSWSCFLNPRTRTRGGDYEYVEPDNLDPDSYDPKDVGAMLVDDSVPGVCNNDLPSPVTLQKRTQLT